MDPIHRPRKRIRMYTIPRGAEQHDLAKSKMEASRRNAAKSTGLRTAEGEAKVKFNAVTHGLTAATVVLPHED